MKTIACPNCGYQDATIVCRYCKADKVPRAEPLRQPAPAEAYYDIFEEIRTAQAILYPKGGST